MIKAKDPWIVRTDVAIPRFLTSPSPEGTQKIELTAQQVANLTQEENDAIPSNEEPKEPVREPSFIDLEEDFEVFNYLNPVEHFEANSRPQAIIQVSINQKVADKPEGIVI